jgi:acyl-coenzyme A thioesterase PaaI-like protein
MSNLAKVTIMARETNNVNVLIDAIPYAKLLGVRGKEGSELVFHLPPSESNVGNPTLPAIHGGAIGGFLELSASLHLIMKMEVLKMPKIIDFSLDYLRAAKLVDTYARCEIVRFGSKIVNVSVEAWQGNENTPVSKARAQFLVE